MNSVAQGMTIAVVVAVCGTGCAPCRMDVEQMKAMLPSRAPEFDALEMLAGSWKTSGRVRMAGLARSIETTGTSKAAWACGRRLMVEHSTFDMGDLGTMNGMSIWTWDARAGRYRMWWFDSFGESATGTARLDEASKTWHVRTVGRNPWTRVRSKGTIQAIDADTLEWTWSQRDGLALFKLAHMQGVSHRNHEQPDTTEASPGEYARDTGHSGK